jgi:hypothetical protein
LSMFFCSVVISTWRCPHANGNEISEPNAARCRSKCVL